MGQEEVLNYITKKKRWVKPSEIQQYLGANQSSISNNIRALRRGNFIVGRKSNKTNGIEYMVK